MSKEARVVTLAIIGGRVRDGKARRACSSATQDLEQHRDDHADRDETRRNGDEVPSDSVEGNGECPQPEDGDAETKAREPRSHERTFTTRDMPQHAAGYEGHDAEPKLHGAGTGLGRGAVRGDA